MITVMFIYIVFLLFLLFATSNSSVKVAQGKYVIVISVFTVALCGSFIVPKSTYDLARLYSDIELIKSSGMKFFDYVFNSAKLTDTNYRYTYSFNALRYVISRLLPEQALPFISLASCYGVMGYVLYDLKKRYCITNFYIGLMILLSNCFLPIVYVYSGVRNEIAFSIIALAVYLRIYKKLHLLYFFLLAFVAATIHPLAMVVVPFVFIARIRPGKKGVLLVVLIPNILYALMERLRFSGISYLRYVGIKFYNYTFVNEHAQGRYFYYSAIVMTMIVLLLSVIKTKQSQNENQIFVNFVSWYSIFALANIQSYQIVMRLPYIYGILAPVVVNTLFNSKNYAGRRKIIQYVMTGVSLLIASYGIYCNYAWMV